MPQILTLCWRNCFFTFLCMIKSWELRQLWFSSQYIETKISILFSYPRAREGTQIRAVQVVLMKIAIFCALHVELLFGMKIVWFIILNFGNYHYQTSRWRSGSVFVACWSLSDENTFEFYWTKYKFNHTTHVQFLLNSGKFEVDFTTQESSLDFIAICWKRVEILIRIYLELGGGYEIFSESLQKIL